ncbi:substrate-binding periplasmic protein [Fluviispira vulneris]|uniref:substrate-binding periplasmic protein n=1 Tax=Fluviispira vulneris TaxID=2763012 RepID=UPI001644C299|nr:transporter substrate-binding domain-containing protein [Fluviispira vulneris]
MSKIYLIFICLFVYSFNLYAASIKDIIIYTDEDVPYVTVDEKGFINGGITTTVIFKVLKKLNLPEKTIVKAPWSRAYNDATTMPNTIIYPIVKTKERMEKLDYLFKIIESTVYFYKLRSRSDIQVKKFDDAKKYKICVQRNDYRSDFLMAKGFTSLEAATSSTLNVKKFVEGRCDLIVSTEIGLQSKLKAIDFDYKNIQKILPLKELDSALYAAINKETDANIKDQIKKAAASVISSRTK